MSLVFYNPDHVVPDELHLLLRICDKLLTNLIDDAKSVNDKNEVLGVKSNNLNELVETIRDCEVSFCHLLNDTKTMTVASTVN
jgi:hypothetical protein